MTPKQRVMACIQGRKTDKVPVHHLQFSGYAAGIITGRECFVGGAYVQWKAIHSLWNDPDSYPAFRKRCEVDAVAVARACGHDLLRLHYWAGAAAGPSRRLTTTTSFSATTPTDGGTNSPISPTLNC